MTTQLYYIHPTLTECVAKVISCEKVGEDYVIKLDRSIIFPEGGGQLPDEGTIEGQPILDAKNVDGDTWHYCKSPIEVGSIVQVKLNLDSRKDHTEQHTGEHILSGLASKLFGAVNVGFHMAKSYCTIDLDIFIDKERVNELEQAANAAVRANRPITTEVVNGKTASKLDLRKHADIISEDFRTVRVVYIDGGEIDSCTCCGTHLRTTGEIGAIKITDSQKYKGGTRLWFVCGGRATKYLTDLQDRFSELARMYSTSRDEVPNAIKKQIDELSDLKHENRMKTAILADLYAEKLISDADKVGNTLLVCKTLDGLAANDLKTLGDKLCEKCDSGVALIFINGKQETNYRMVCKGVDFSMKELCAAVNGAVNGKGGGSSEFAQGKTMEKVGIETIEMLKKYIKKVIDNRT